MKHKVHISEEANKMVEQLLDQRERIEALPDSDKKFELLDRIDANLDQLQCGDHCSFCGDAAFTGDDDDDSASDPIIQKIATKFQILPNMNKKVIAGVLIIASIAIAVVGIKMWRKSAPAITEGK